jgi:hypothetical protein
MPRRRKPKKVPDLVRRNRALIAVQQQFGGKALDLGAADCVQLVRFHLVKMGHRNLPPATGYDDAVSARKVLRSMGFETLEELFDSLLPRIAPAFMLPGDVAVVAAEEGAPAWEVGTVVISIGRKFLGWHPDADCLAIIDPKIPRPFVAAWRA